MRSRRTYRVKEVVDLAGISIRALHYREVGILVPRHRTDAGYRLYADEDLPRLQQILIGRELGWRSRGGATREGWFAAG